MTPEEFCVDQVKKATEGIKSELLQTWESTSCYIDKGIINVHVPVELRAKYGWFLANAPIIVPALLAEIERLNQMKELGEAVKKMPANSSLHYRPFNSNDIAPSGFMPWVFERPGEPTIDAQDPLTALIFANSKFAPPEKG